MSSLDCEPVQETGASAVASNNVSGNESDERAWTPRNARTCGICQDLKDDIKFELSALIQSAENGCSFCHILRKGIEGFRGAENEMDDKLYILRYPQYLCVYGLSISSFPGIEFYVLQDESPLRDYFPVSVHLPENTASEESFSWAQKQMHTCLSQHSECAVNSDPPFMPTRVLDLGSGPYPDDRDIRVLETNQEIDRRYIALSHCWGDPKLMRTKLTAHTFDEYHDKISYDLLPRTFQDAVTITRKMKVRYLWIDSLCIIQADKEKDSPEDAKRSDEDWRHESSKMCSVFQNSYLTLAAAISTGCNDGIFSSPKLVPISILDHRNQGRPAYVFARASEHNQWNFPLLRRGWVTQEILLSLRIILFARDELLWLCKKGISCQCENNRYSLDELVYAWNGMIENYSRTLVTIQSDRLVAIDGLAQCISPFRSGEYLAGLWSDSLAIDLLWYTKKTPPQKRLVPTGNTRKTKWTSEKWLFPTWSWASTAHPVFWFSFLEGVTSFVTRVEEGDKMPSYHLKLRGVLLYTTLESLKGDPDRQGYQYFPDYVQDQLNDKVACLRVVEYCRKLFSLVVKCVDEEKNVYERIGLLRTRYGVRRAPYWWEPYRGWEPDEVEITLE
ncbi:HET-domain-containing protein [Massarina eburnea CBS 473.64]|uniref:HET-domain-containing protein n=1 Tax=Massarina eburnea CBS 473.64 TaxID=1395130 RepID=A0A6A6SIU5_9PLEO|nr:HET-domain-containing protein [Massarina eburnea CBS 473.64]